MLITVFTPTFNRANTLQRLYESLLGQTCYDFEWIVVDDGSIDDTYNLIQSFYKKNHSFEIRYFYQENGGKHTAINRGMIEANGELFFIVDSDDVLTADAIRTIVDDWKKVEDNNLCGISYLRGFSENKVIGDQHPTDHGIGNFIDVRVNQNVGGDKAEVWVTKLMRAFPFPVFPNEKFIGETYIWYQLAEKYDMLFVNKIIYITEYLGGGLTKSGKAMRIKNPLGAIELCKIAMSPSFCYKAREKKAMLYVAYHFFAKKGFKDMMVVPYKGLVLLNYVPGYLLYRYWNLKYNK